MSPPAEAVDQVGAATLERMAAAPRYNRWMFDRLRPWMGRRVLEIGAGNGNMSVFFADRERVVLTDTEPYYLGRLRERFAGRPHVTVAELRLPALSPGLAAERLDSVVCLNVLEHIEDDGAALSAMHQLLEPGGRLVLLVPGLRASACAISSTSTWPASRGGGSRAACCAAGSFPRARCAGTTRWCRCFGWSGSSPGASVSRSSRSGRCRPDVARSIDRRHP